MAKITQLVTGVAQRLQGASLAWLLSASIAIFLVQWTIRGVYRVYFHPLARFPGPKLSAFTRLPHNIAVWTGRTHKYTLALHEQYGEVVRVAPDELSFVNPDAWRDIHGHGHSQGKSAQGSVPPKHWTWYGKSSNGVANLVEEENSEDHARMRRVFKPAFSDRALKDQEPLFVKYVDQLVGNLSEAVRKQPGMAIDMVKNYNYTTFDVMGDLTFGESLHMLDESKYDPWVSVIFASIRFLSRFNLIHHYPWLSRVVLSFSLPSIERLKLKHFNYSAERVSKRLERGRKTKGRDLWDLVLGSDEARTLSRAEMDSNAMLFMAAGSETTATLLSGLTYLLLRNPDAMQQINDEIRGAFAESKDFSFEAIATLPYLGGCVKEALRLYPPAPIGLPHLTPADGSTICGLFVPPHTIVSAPHYAMYRSAHNFRDPHAFVPERWLGNEKFAGDRKVALQPFSVGSRDCLGKNMAYHEMRLIISKVLFQFDLQLCPESEDWADQRSFVLWEKQPLMVTLKDVRV